MVSIHLPNNKCSIFILWLDYDKISEGFRAHAYISHHGKQGFRILFSILHDIQMFPSIRVDSFTGWNLLYISETIPISCVSLRGNCWNNNFAVSHLLAYTIYYILLLMIRLESQLAYKELAIQVFWRPQTVLLIYLIGKNIVKQGVCVPILPSTGITTPSQLLPPYQVPELWPFVKVLKEVIYSYKSCLLENYDLSQVGKDKPLDQQVELFIKMKWRDTPRKKVQQIEHLSRHASLPKLKKWPWILQDNAGAEGLPPIPGGGGVPSVEKSSRWKEDNSDLNKVRWEVLHTKDCLLFCYLSAKIYKLYSSSQIKNTSAEHFA